MRKDKQFAGITDRTQSEDADEANDRHPTSEQGERVNVLSAEQGTCDCRLPFARYHLVVTRQHFLKPIWLKFFSSRIGRTYLDFSVKKGEKKFHIFLIIFFKNLFILIYYYYYFFSRKIGLRVSHEGLWYTDKYYFH